MKITGYSEHAFWSYDKESDLPEEVIIRQILLYGEIKDMLRLVKLIRHDKIEKVLSSFSINHQNIKRINFFRKVILS